MNLRKISFVLIGLTVIFTAVSAFAQVSSFSDPNVEYTFDLPDTKWKMIGKPSATNPNVEYVYGDRIDGLFSVRKTSLTKDTKLTDVINDEEQKRQFLPGYVKGKDEIFAGKLKGAILNYEYVNAGHNMGGRTYFLRAGDATVYVLRFTGLRDSLRSLRNQTDQIARSFAVK